MGDLGYCISEIVLGTTLRIPDETTLGSNEMAIYVSSCMLLLVSPRLTQKNSSLDFFE